MDDKILESYEQWKRCIASAYGRLTIEFIDERILTLEDTANACTRKFINTYGKAHHSAVIAWLKRERRQMQNNG